MKDISSIIDLKRMTPQAAKGKFCIDLTDPDTGKVKSRVEDTNYVFTNMLFTSSDWTTQMNSTVLALTDSDYAIDPNFPFILGDVKGYGIPSTNGSGTYRGAYNATNQVLKRATLDSVRWKFQYDFTTAQANSTIKTIGLSNQFRSASLQILSGYIAPTSSLTENAAYTSDGRCSYWCTTAGIIKKYDAWASELTTIDVSATVGTTSNTTKTVGYIPSTNKYFIYCYSSTAANRKLYIFSANDFATLENTYSPSNVAIFDTNPAYIYDNYLFVFNGDTVYIADFVNNTAYTTATMTYSTLGSDGSYYYNRAAYRGCLPYNNFVVMFANSFDSSGHFGYIFDMDAKAQVGYLSAPLLAKTGNYYFPPVYYPYNSLKTPAIISPYAPPVTYGTIAAKKLAAPVTKTSSYGMTATYELEVFWDEI